MVSKINSENTACLVDLGYVGLPLAEAFSKHFRVIGYNIDEEKIKRLSSENNNFEFTSNPLKIKLADFVMVTVPTPVSRSKEPDLSFIKPVAKILDQNLKKGKVQVNKWSN